MGGDPPTGSEVNSRTSPHRRPSPWLGLPRTVQLMDSSSVVNIRIPAKPCPSIGRPGRKTVQSPRLTCLSRRRVGQAAVDGDGGSCRRCLVGQEEDHGGGHVLRGCLLYTSPSPRD